MEDSADITILLNDWMDGDSAALEQLAPLVYDQLRRFARRAFASESGNHTLQPTALVNEVFLKLVNTDVPWQSRAHFYALSARMMRRLLINHANERNAEKRGGKPCKPTVIQPKAGVGITSVLERAERADRQCVCVVEIAVV